MLKLVHRGILMSIFLIEGDLVAPAIPDQNHRSMFLRHSKARLTTMDLKGVLVDLVVRI
jgi:hypothetical protein